MNYMLDTDTFSYIMHGPAMRKYQIQLGGQNKNNFPLR